MALNSGIQNEKEIQDYIDGKTIMELNPNLRAFILDIFGLARNHISQSKISARRTCDTDYKPDMIIKYEGQIKNISIKIGNGNSVHQEKISEFIEYCKKLGVNQETIDDLLFFHWGDGTLDGSAPVSERRSAKEIISSYPEKIANVQKFFNKHTDELLDRFLSSGTKKLSHVDFIYYGNYSSGDWHSIKQVFQYLKENVSDPLSVAGLNFQTYGRSLNGQDDKRRQDIQLKWSGMQSYFLVSKKSFVDIYSKVKGDNSHGFQNVDNIISAIDNRCFGVIPDSLKEFIFTIFNGCALEDVIHAEKVVGHKGDILFWQNNDKNSAVNVAVASGSGNSFHQEKVSSFTDFLINDLKMPYESIKSYLEYQYADGTDNNTGGVSSRQSGSEYKKEHEYELSQLSGVFASYGRQLIERFIKKNNNYPDVKYLFYGDTELPYWASIDALITEEIAKVPNHRAALAIGDFSIQAWNRSLRGQADYKRDFIQIKWNNLLENVRTAKKRDDWNEECSHTNIARIAADDDRSRKIKEANIAIRGIGYELKFVSMMNEDKKYPLWNELGIKNLSNVYMVNVSYNQVSKVAGTKVKPKSDCYVVKTMKNIDLLVEKLNFALTEEDLLIHQIDYTPIMNSGISIKIPSSNSFTIQKLSFSSFKNIFTEIDPLNFVAELLFVSVNELNKNELIYSTFQTSIEKLCSVLNVDATEENNIETCKKLKSKARDNILSQLRDRSIYNKICFGDELFEDPYCASYIFEHNKLVGKEAYSQNIGVTTGSGRSSGKYTLAFK